MSIVDWSLRDTGYAAVAIKTTGLTQGYDRICEVAVALAEPGQPVRLILDSIVNPERKLAGSELHGIHDFSMNAMAPIFEEVALDLLRQFQGRVIVGHNLNFTLAFLKSEYEPFDIDFDGPFLDTMSLTSMLTKTPSRPLLEACDQMGIEASLDPTAAAAALDTARLLRVLLQKVHGMGLTTFKHIQGKKRRPFQRSLDLEPMLKGFTHDLPESVARVSRHERGVEGSPDPALALYWDALLVALEDQVVTKAEKEHLMGLQSELQLNAEQVYMLHARIFNGALTTVIHTGHCSSKDRTFLASLHALLIALGWAPGSEVTEATDSEAPE